MNTGFIDITTSQKNEYNAVVAHPLQSFEWGEFRAKTGVTVIRRAQLESGKINNAFTVTLHKVPALPYFIGYLPKGKTPSQDVLDELMQIGRQYNCVYIQLEPNVKKDLQEEMPEILRPSFHPLFTKYTFILDLTNSKEDILKNMQSKTRYNIRVAEKHKVKIIEDNSKEAFEDYLRLTFETTHRQKFYAHDKEYHRKQFETLPHVVGVNSLSSHLLHAKYTDEYNKTHTLASWILFVFHKTLYYPYGASSSLYRNVMASTLIMWEAILFGKKHKCESFDMWGALGAEPDKNDPWYGFHRFKEGYGATLTEFTGSYDLIINPAMYEALKVGDKVRWMMLKLKK